MKLRSRVRSCTLYIQIIHAGFTYTVQPVARTLKAGPGHLGLALELAPRQYMHDGRITQLSGKNEEDQQGQRSPGGAGLYHTESTASTGATANASKQIARKMQITREEKSTWRSKVTYFLCRSALSMKPLFLTLGYGGKVSTACCD